MNTKSIKNKIKAVKNTKKITKAMEMIAAAKMRKAIAEAASARDYARLAADIVATLSGQPDTQHGLMNAGKSSQELVIIIAASRGLCGSYNSNVASAFKKYMASNDEQGQREYSAFAINKKAGQIARRLGVNLAQFYQDFPEKYGYNTILPILTAAKEAFLKGEYSKVSIVYTRFISSLSQQAEVTQLLPISKENLEQFAGSESSGQQEYVEEFVVEPSAGEVLGFALERVIEVQLLQTLLESSASEHSSRMVAMKSASDAAGDMIDSLTLEYNKSRQAAITQEISEISNAAAAIV